MACRSAVATAYLKSTSAKLFTNLSLIVGAENLGIHSQHTLVSVVAWNYEGLRSTRSFEDEECGEAPRSSQRLPSLSRPKLDGRTRDH
jgi:hypothetical protein